MDTLILRGDPPSWISGSGYYGYGFGSGYGEGLGDGSGYGDGDGDGAYWQATVKYFAAKWSKEQYLRLHELHAQGATIAFWRSDIRGLPANGGRGIVAAAPGVVHTVPGPLNLCCAGTLHATLIPPKWEGERWWVVALIGEVIGDEEKFGCLKREIIGECL